MRGFSGGLGGFGVRESLAELFPTFCGKNPECPFGVVTNGLVSFCKNKLAAEPDPPDALKRSFNMLKVMGTPADSKSEQQTQTKHIISTILQKVYRGLWTE
jgi:hypothetical protein